MSTLLSLLFRRLGNERKMVEAVTARDVAAVSRLVQAGFNVNSKLQRQGGNSALHLAAQLGDETLVTELLTAGGDPMLKNDLNSTPIIIAARNQHVTCLETLIAAAPTLLGIESLWLQHSGSIFLWRESCEKVVYCFICATPTLGKLRSNTSQNLFFLCVDKKMYRCLRLWVALGNRLSPSQIAYLNSDEDKRHLEWVRDYQRRVKTLRHCCSLVLRASFHNKCNVFYGVELLPLPRGLKEFIMWK